MAQRVDSPQPYQIGRSGGILTLTFDRPEQGNALPPEAVPGVIRLFQDAQSDPSVRCLLIRGAGKHFSTGGDVARFAQTLSRGQSELRASFLERMANVTALVKALLDFDRPIVAAVQGGVVGAGLLYPLAADLVVGEATTFFLFAHQRMGLSPDAGVSWLLPRVVGLRSAKALLLTGARVEAEEARHLGLLTQMVMAEQGWPTAENLAQRLAEAPQCATRTAKRLLNQSLLTPLAEQLDAEAAGVVAAVGDPDFAEGVNSFLEKRPVNFPSTRS